MKKNSMRFLSFLLAAIMVIAMFPAGVFAEDTVNDVNETASQPSETWTWKDGDVIDGITISKDVTINVSGTVTVNGTIRLASDAICNVVFNGSENAKLIRGEGFTGQMFYAEGTSDNFQKLTFNNITLDGGAVWTGDVDKTLNRGTTNAGVKATGSLLFLMRADAVLNNSVLQNHDDSTGEMTNAVCLRYYSSFTVNDSIVRNNNSIATYYRGGVVTIRQGGTVKTNNADVYGNSGPAGGFVGISSSGAYGGIAEVKDSKFHNNYADNGAVFLMQCNSKIGYLSIEGCEFYENASKTAVLTEWAYSRPFIIKDSYFHDNECAVWDCHADPVLDLSGKIVVEEDADYTKYLFETPLVLGGALTDGSSIAISEASLTKLLSTKAYVVTGTADYAITNNDLAKFVLPEGYKLLVADVNFDGIMDAVPADVDSVVSQATVTLKDSLDADASETRTVIAGLAYNYGTPFAHTGFTFTGWQKDDGKAVNAPIAVTSDSILTAQWKLANPSVAVSVNGATLTATISNANEDIDYTYQWYIDGTAIDGATADTYTMTDYASHKYRCTVTASYEGYKSTSGKKEVTASVPAAAQIGNDYYETLKDAIDAANAIEGGATVTLLADVTLSEKLTISGNVTIEGAHTITRGIAGTIFAVDKNATLTLDGGVIIDGANNWTFDSENFYADMAAGKTLSTGAKESYSTSAEGGLVATAQLITISGIKGALVMNNATIQNTWGSPLFAVPAGATLTMNDGSLIQHVRGQLINPLNGSWVMEGGKITDVHAHNTNGGLVDMRGSSTFTINGGEICYVTVLGLNANGNGILAQVYGNTTKLTINDGYIHDNASFSPGGGWGSVVYLNRGGDFEMNGGTIEHTASDHCTAFVSNTSTSIVLNAGTIVIEESKAARFDSLIYGDTVIGENMKIEGDGLVVLLGDPGDTFENNGIIDSDMQICYGEVTGNGTYNGDVIIKVDDYFEFDGKVVISGGTWNGQLTVEDGASLSITGGIFANDPSEWLADGYKVTKLADGTYGVAVDPAYGKVAQVGDEYYETLKDAIAAANAIEGGATVTLLADVTLSEKLTISGNVTISGTYTITRDDAYTGTLFTVAADATLTLDGGLVIDGNNNWTLNEELYNKALALEVTGVTWDELITSEEGKPNATAPMFKVTGSLVANNVTIQNNYSNKSSNNGDYGVFQVDANATLTMTGATIKHIVTGGANSVAHLSTNSVWTINDGTLITDTFAAKNGGICRNDSGKLVMNGGEISNNKALNTNGTVVMLYMGSMEMNGGIICSNSGISGAANGRCAVIYGHSTSTFIMTDGEICHNTGISYGGVDVPSSIKVEISGGYIGENISVNGNANADVNGNANTVITGGTFTQDVSAWLAPNTGLEYVNGQYTVINENLFKLHLTDPNTGEPATIPYLDGNDLASLVATGKLFYADYYEMTLEILYDVKIDETVVIDYPMTIDLNGHTLTGVNVYPVIRVQGGAHVDVKNGTIINNDDYVFVLGASDGSTYGNLTIKSGKYVGGTTVASVTLGALTITGGEFEAKDTGYGHDYTLNCIDANYKNGAASIVVTGGTFYKFNPADNAAEGANTSFVNDKYLAEADGDYYTVRVNKNALPAIADIVITTENGETITLKYPSERFDSIQHIIGTNDYADFVPGADQNEMLAYVANGNVTEIVMNLYDDIALDAPLSFYNKYFQIPVEYAITVNGNGHTITWADGYNGTLINVENGANVTLKDITIDGENAFTFYDDTTTVENDQNWYTRFVDVGEEDKAINDNVIVNAGDLTLDSVRITGVTIASDGNNGKTENTESGYVLKYNDDLALIKSNGGSVTLSRADLSGNAGMVLNAINAKTVIENSIIDGNFGCGNKGGIITANGGTMELSNASICGNKAMARSATVLGVINGAEVAMNGNTRIDNNKHIGVGSNTAGAMIVLEGASQFVMDGGSISNNIGGRAGAIASRWVGGNYGQHEDTSIVLNAGTIKGNTASNDSWNGASVFLRSPAAIGEGMKIDGTIAVNAAPGALEITGGTFNGSLTVTDGLVAEITGGTFDYDPSEWVVEGYVAPKNDDGTYSVRSQTYVEWIKAELLAGNSVKLDRDVVITDYDLVNALVLPSNGNGQYTEAHGNGAVFHVIKPGVVFDLNGYSLIWDAHDDVYCNKRQVSLFMVTITGNPGETADLTIIDSSAAKTGKVEVYGMGTGLYVVGVDAKGTISGGTWTNYPCNTCGAFNIFIYPSHGGELYITDGTFEQKDSDYLIGWNGSSKPTTNNGVGIDQDATKVYITGGTFVGFNPETDVKFIDTANGSAVSEVNGCAEGYESTDNGDGTYGVIPTKLAKVEVEIMPGFWGTSYITVENWADLVAALGENTNVPVKVTLLENIKLTDEVLTIAGTTKKVIDLNGKRITGTFTEETTAFVYVTGGCELTILDSTVTEVDGFTAGGIHAIDTNGNLSNLIRVETDGKLVIESGSYSQDASVNGAGMIDSRGDEIITIKGGHFRLYNIGSAENGSPWILNASSQNTKNIIVLGGTYNADIIHQYYPFEVMAPKELALVQGEDGIWHFVPAVAYVNEQEWSSNWYTNEVGYATLEDAIAAVEGIRTKNGKTSAEEFITLLADAVVTGDVDTKGITIEQNGFAIKLAAGATLTAPEGLNVTTDVANRKVVYENGVYKLTVITYAAQIGDTLYETIQDAVYAAQDGDIIIVLVDHEMNCADAVANTSGYAVLVNVANKAVTIDLNGKVITVNVDQNAEIYGIFATDTNGKLTLMDSSADKTGKVEITAPGYLYSVLFAYGADSKLTVNGGRYVADTVSDSLIYSQHNEIVEINDGYFYLGNVGTGSNGKPWIFNAKGQNTAHAIVKGGIFNADIIHQFYPFEVSAPKELALVKGVGGIWYFVPAVAYVNEQEWSSNWYTNEVGYATFAEAIAAVEGIRTKNGKTSAEEFITLLGDVMVTGNVDTKGITIVQGRFAIRLGIADATLTAVEGLNVTTDVANREVVYENGVYKLAVISYAAQIGDTLYETLQDAIDKAEDYDEIIVLENINIADQAIQTLGGKYNTLFLVEDKIVTVNLNGKIISGTYTGDSMLVGVFSTDNGGKLTLTGNGTIDVTADSTVYGLIVAYRDGSSIVIENGTYKLDKASDSLIYYGGKTDAEVVVKGGTFELGNPDNENCPWIFNVSGKGDHYVLVTGGTFNTDINRQKWNSEVIVPVTHYTVNNGDGTWTVTEGAAAHVHEGMLNGPYYAPKEIGYATIEEAIAAAIAKNDDPITLLTDFVLTAPIDAAGKTFVQNGFAIKLATVDATLTAAEGLNVTTDVANRKVVYENGVYKLAVISYAAQIGDTKYETLAEAILFAQPGDTITLLANVSEDVTINKSITLDGAKFEYTGNITVTGETVDVIIKNVNFGNGTNYAVTTSHLNSITVEDCTVTGRAFLYSKLATQSIVVKNVTVTGGNYVANITYGSEAYFENVTAIDMTGFGIYTQNYGAKTITLKNCSFDTPNYSSIAVRADRTAATDTFIFEGNNVMTSLRENERTKYVLADVDATLTAPEGYTVTTTLADHKVVHEEGTYKVIPKDYVAEVNGVKYETLKDAFEACTNGETILLLKDLVYGDDDIVNAIGGATGFGQYPNPSIIYVGGTAGATPDENKPSNVNAVLDLNGHSITNNADAYLFLFMDNCKVTIKDSGNGDGIINNTELPAIWVVGTETLVTIESGKYSTESSSGVIHATHGGDLVITGGEFRTSASDATYLIVLNSHNNQNSKYFITGNATITVSGGTFYGFNPEQTLDAKTDKFVNVVAKRYIAQDNGDNSWTVVLGKVYNATTGNTFATIADAMLDAKLSTSNNDQIELLQNHEESVVLIYDGTTLNLKSFTLKADYLVSFAGGYITGDPCADKDSGARLIVPKQFVALAENAAVSGKGHALPIWDATANNNKGAFVFAQMAVSVKTNSGVTTDRNGNEILFVQFGINGTGFVKKNLLFEQAVSGFHVEIVASWNPLDDNGNVKSDTITQVYRFSDEAVTKVALGSSNFTGSVLLEGHENLTMYVRFVTDAGVVLSSAPLKAN